MAELPLLIGVLHDFPAPDGGSAFEWAAGKGFAEVAAGGHLPGPVTFVHETAAGLPLPGGSAHSVEQAFKRLVDAGVLAILGPAITDNALVTRPLSDRDRVATINYTGSEETRGEFAFHFQIGSLEDEPAFLADHLSRRQLRRVALVQDTSHIGRRMAEYFEDACATHDIALVGRHALGVDPPTADAAVAALARTDADALVSLGLWGVAHAVAVARREIDWGVPAVANSALIYGHHDRAWARDWHGWTYMDTVSDANPRYRALQQVAAAEGRGAGPGAAGAYDMGRLLAEGIARARHLTRDEICRGLERVKALPSATGREGTLMGFGRWDRGALKGPFLVTRQWRDGDSVEWELQ